MLSSEHSAICCESRQLCWRAWDTGTMPPLPSHLAAPHFYAVQSILGSLMPCIFSSSLSLRDEREEKSWCRDEQPGHYSDKYHICDFRPLSSVTLSRDSRDASRGQRHMSRSLTHYPLVTQVHCAYLRIDYEAHAHETAQSPNSSFPFPFYFGLGFGTRTRAFQLAIFDNFKGLKNGFICFHRSV